MREYIKTQRKESTKIGKTWKKEQEVKRQKGKDDERKWNMMKE